MHTPKEQPQIEGLLAAFQLAEQSKLIENEIQSANTAATPTWLHFERNSSAAASWLRDHSGLDEPIVDALLADATRPRLTKHGRGILVMLRGYNEAPGADPDDLMSLRIWAEPERVISLQGRTLQAAAPVITSLAAGTGPRTTGDLLVALLESLIGSLVPLVDSLVKQAEELEDRVLDPSRTASRTELIGLRQQGITLHRFLAPQAMALRQLSADVLDLFDQQQQQKLIEAANRVTRLAEEVDAARQRTAVVQDELANQLAEQANQRIYLLTVITAMFLPLSLITGLLGMNVGGIPLSENPAGFVITNSVLFGLLATVLLLARHRGWI